VVLAYTGDEGTQAMFARLTLGMLQFLAGYFAAPYALVAMQQNSIIVPEPLNIFVLAGIYAVVVWFSGLFCFILPGDAGRPMPSTFIAALICASAMAGVTLIPEAIEPLNLLMQLPVNVYPLIGAVIGYTVIR